MKPSLESHPGTVEQMSRESTPASLLAGLAITGSPTSSTDMPVTTRGMRTQRQRNLHASHQASTGVAAGSSRAATASSSRQAARRSTGRATNPPPSRRRLTQAPPNDDDSEQEDDDSDDDESDEETADRIIIEIMATFADHYPTPQEFVRINPRNTRNVSGIEQTRDCRRLSDILANMITRDPEGLNLLRQEFSREYCAARFVTNLWNRDAMIMRNLSMNLEEQTRGRDVGDSIVEWRRLNIAIESTLHRYSNDLTDRHRQSLASLLISILSRIFQTDRDLYAGRVRTAYAGESGNGNLFRRFLSPRSEPIAFLSSLQRLDAGLLANRADSLRDLIGVFTANGEAGSEGEQYRLVAQALMGIWSSATGQQL